MDEEGIQEGGFSLQGPSVAAGGACEGRQIEMRRVGQRIGFQVAPGELDRIQIGGISRQEIGLGIRARGQELSGSAGAMGVEAIPQQQPGSWEFAIEVAQKRQHVPGLDVGVGVKAEIKPPLVAALAQDGNHGNFLVMHAALQQQGRLSARRPTAANQRSHQEAAFIEKDQPGIQLAGFFLTADQVERIHWRTVFSSRSMARRCGFWGVKPKAWSRRQTWSA